MTKTRNVLTVAALVVVAATPTAALAKGGGDEPALRGSPQLHLIDGHHAELTFAADPIGRSHGDLDAGLSAGQDRKIRHVKVEGPHGSDRRYSTILSSSKTRLREGAKYTIRFRLGDADRVSRTAKLYAAKKGR